jgi:hypothetical protein
MGHHRFREQQRLVLSPVVTGPVPSREAFMVCPAVLTQGWMGQPCPWRPVYQLAYERALAVLRPSRLERLQRVWCN